ncbi:MAG: hypothetical protein WEB52_07440 [Dehalococcoidia bacterium]
MILTRISYLLIAAVVAVAAAAVCAVLDTDEATTNPPITLEQMIRNAAAIDSVRQSGRQITVRFEDDFNAQAAFGIDSRTFEATLDEGINVADVFRFANVPVGDDGVRVISE